MTSIRTLWRYFSIRVGFSGVQCFDRWFRFGYGSHSLRVNQVRRDFENGFPQ